MFTSETKSKGKKDEPVKAPKTVKKIAINSGDVRKPWYMSGFVFGILGLALFLVFVSIAYSAVVIVMGTSGITPKIMIAPMVLFNLVLAGIAFSKILK